MKSGFVSLFQRGLVASSRLEQLAAQSAQEDLHVADRALDDDREAVGNLIHYYLTWLVEEKRMPWSAEGAQARVVSASAPGDQLRASETLALMAAEQERLFH